MDRPGFLRVAASLAEYACLATAFNPILADSPDWMKQARGDGVKHFAAPSKHHDGFAFFLSKVSAYNIADATPFRHDPVEEAGRRRGSPVRAREGKTRHMPTIEFQE